MLLLLLMQGCQKAFVRWLHARIIVVITVVSALTIVQVRCVHLYAFGGDYQPQAFCFRAVRPCVRPCVRGRILKVRERARCLTNRLRKFRQIYSSDAVGEKDEPIVF